MSDLVIVIAPASEYPRTSRIAARVNDYLVIVGSVDEVLASCLPVEGLGMLEAGARKARPGHAHALIMSGPSGRVLRFRVPI